jgi:hypothetical protein
MRLVVSKSHVYIVVQFVNERLCFYGETIKIILATKLNSPLHITCR